MKNYLKILAFLIFTSIYSNNSDILKITTSGSGETKELAVQEALRSALEQSYGTFISTKTNIKNDELIDDEIVSITNGDIHKYEIISEVSLSNTYEVVVQSQISLNQINNFKSQIGEDKISFDGKLFGVKRKLQKINQDAERISLKNLIETLDALYKNSIDFEMKDYSNPQLSDDGKFGITFTVSINYNDNYEKFLSHLLKSLKSIAMNSRENKSFTNLNIETYPIVLGDNTFYFRNEDSYVILSDLFYGLVEKYYSFEVLTDTGLKLLSPSRCHTVAPGRYFTDDERKWFKANCNDFDKDDFIKSFKTPFIELVKIVKLDVSQAEFQYLDRYEKRRQEDKIRDRRGNVVIDGNDKVMYWIRSETKLSGVDLDLYTYKYNRRDSDKFWAGTRLYRGSSGISKLKSYKDMGDYYKYSLFIREPFLNVTTNYKNEKSIMFIGAKDIIDTYYRKELKVILEEVSNIQLNYFGGIDGNENYYPKIDGKKINFNDDIIYNPEARFKFRNLYSSKLVSYNYNYSKIKSSLSNSKFKKFKKNYDEIKSDMDASLVNYNSNIKSKIKYIMSSMKNTFKNEITFTHYFDESTLEKVSDFKVINMLTK